MDSTLHLKSAFYNKATVDYICKQHIHGFTFVIYKNKAQFYIYKRINYYICKSNILQNKNE